MNTDLDRLVDAARAAFAAAMQPAALENEKARYLGKNGAITERLKALAKLAPEEKRTAGASINAAKEAIEALLAERRQALAELRLDEQLARRVDRRVVTGSKPQRRRDSSNRPHVDACRRDLSLDRIRFRRRSGDRNRLV